MAARLSLSSIEVEKVADRCRTLVHNHSAIDHSPQDDRERCLRLAKTLRVEHILTDESIIRSFLAPKIMVTIRGLQINTGHNGRSGTVKKIKSDGRFAVRLDGEKCYKKFGIKAENLSLRDSSYARVFLLYFLV
jgi:hypothetical protein